MNFYAVKHWFVTLLIGPLVIAIMDQFMSVRSNIFGSGMLDFYVLMLTFGLLFSLPALAFYLLVFGLLLETEISALALKWILNAFGILLVIITFYVTGLHTGFKLITAGYCVSVILSSLLAGNAKKEHK